jgi:hypothetical protein
MATTYEPCDAGVRELADELIRSHFGELKEAGVTVAYLFASNPDGPALTHGGYEAAGIAKINNLKDRVEGKTDATIFVSAEWWQDKSDREREALLFHELYHFEVKRDEKNGRVSRDDINRPKLKIRKHDFQVGGFHRVAQEYGMDGAEVQAVAQVNQSWKLLDLFAEQEAVGAK